MLIKIGYVFLSFAVGKYIKTNKKNKFILVYIIEIYQKFKFVSEFY